MSEAWTLDFARGLLVRDGEQLPFDGWEPVGLGDRMIALSGTRRFRYTEDGEALIELPSLNPHSTPLRVVPSRSTATRANLPKSGY